MRQQFQATEKAISTIDSILLKVSTLAHAGMELTYRSSGNEDDLGEIRDMFSLIADLAKEAGAVTGNVI